MLRCALAVVSRWIMTWGEFSGQQLGGRQHVSVAAAALMRCLVLITVSKG
jgi:hypothetical protein